MKMNMYRGAGYIKLSDLRRRGAGERRCVDAERDGTDRQIDSDIAEAFALFGFFGAAVRLPLRKQIYSIFLRNTQLVLFYFTLFYMYFSLRSCLGICIMACLKGSTAAY